jgi:hypothetical protein
MEYQIPIKETFNETTETTNQVILPGQVCVCVCAAGELNLDFC